MKRFCEDYLHVQIPPSEVGTVHEATVETDYDPDLEAPHEER